MNRQIISQPPKQSLVSSAGGLLQRKCDKFRKNESGLQRSATGSAPYTVPQTLLSPREQDASTLAFTEPRFSYDFSHIPVYPRLPANGQAKLAVSLPGDIYEQEADRVSEQMMAPSAEAVPHIQPISRESNEQSASASVDPALAGPGKPLEPAFRQGMEQRFGYDFSRVRVHSGAKAEQSAREVSARAYTVGSDIVFGSGLFAPGTRRGRRLIAHELTHVVQQNKGAVALQRQPQDIDTLSHDIKEMTEDLEKIKKQLSEGAEDLEIVRWRLALQGKKLPKAATPIANMQADVAFFAEGLIETSNILGPYLRGKLAKTSVNKNFKIYDFRSEFEKKHDELEPPGAPSIGKATPQTQTYGFYHRATDSIHLSPDANFGHALHEAVHKYSSIAIQSALGLFINEGVTQYFTDSVLAERSLGNSSNIYGPNLKCAKTVLGWINNDEKILARAYFRGDANPLLQEVMNRLGLRAAKDLFTLIRDRGGLGLCESIEQKGP